MRKTSSLEKESPSFAALVAAPTASLILGIVFIYLTETPWQLAPAGIVSGTLWGAIIGTLVYAVLALLTRLPIADGLKEILRQLRPILKDRPMWQLLVLSGMAGLGEEVFFRGFLQVWLAEYMMIEAAILISAILFGLLHFASVGYFLLTTLLGLVLGITYWVTGSLLLIIVWHAVYDAIAMWLLARHPRLIGIEP